MQNKEGWRGYSTYNRTDSTVSRAYTPLSQHGTFHATKAWTPLTRITEHAMKEFVQNSERFTAQDLVKIVEKHQGHRPTDAWLTMWSKNHRVHKGTKKDPLCACKWLEADWRRVRREHGATQSTQDSPDALKVAGALFQPDAAVVVFCNPCLLQTTLSRLTDKDCINLCGDVTFRLLSDGDWVLLTVGVLSKHYAPSAIVYAFRTSFSPGS